jgi:NAD(P)-dependent dehydrogenase (short-subunit alcohol dehydrogenase family)
MAPALSGKVAIVTGAASGIGRATAIALAEQGAAVAVLDKDNAGIEAVAAAIASTGGRALALPIDLIDITRCAPLVDEVVATLGRIDILVNGAGIDVGQVDFLAMDDAIWELVHTVNLRAPMLLMQAAGRHMVAQGEGGRIVNVTSSAGFRAGKAQAAYASSKAGLTQLTRNVAAELGGHGINVNAVAPGVTATPMALRWFKEKDVMAQEARPGGSVANLLHQIAEAEDVAATIVFLCLDASRQITAQTIHTSAGTVV